MKKSRILIVVLTLSLSLLALSSLTGSSIIEYRQVSSAKDTKDKEKSEPAGQSELSQKEKAQWVDALIKKLCSNDLWVRVEAIKKLGNLKDPKAVLPLSQALNDESVDVNVEALRALKKIGDNESLQLLLAGTTIYDMQSLRFYALEASLTIDPIKTREHLKLNLKSKSPNIRNNAAESLANLIIFTNKRDKESIEQLVNLLSQEEDKSKREKIAESLNIITQAELTSAEPKDWQEWWSKNRKTISETIKPKEVVTGTEPPAPKTPAEEAKDKEQKKAEEKFDDFKDKTILDKKPDDQSKSYFAGRSEEGKTLSVAAFAGGDPRVLKLVENALNWLHRHQEKEGFWDYNGYAKRCPLEKADDSSQIKGDYDVAVTGLALLAFLGAGHTHIPACVPNAFGTGKPGQNVGLPTGGKYKPTVERGLRWLLSIQKQDGSFANPVSKAPKINMFEQAMATLAVSEAYGMTGDLTLRDPAQRAVNFISQARNPDQGWRYTPNCGDNDTSVIGWQVFALKSGKVSGLGINRNDFVDASKWLDDMTNLETAQVGYNKKGSGSTTITSIGIICKMLLGWRNDSPILQKGAEIVLKDNSYQGETQNFYHIYQTALAMFQMGGRYWENWNKQMTDFLAKTAVSEGCEHGSWPAQSEKWSKSRVYTTALGALSLEVYYRYLPFARTEKSEQPF